MARSRQEIAAATLIGAGLCAAFLFANPFLDPDYLARVWSDHDIAWQSYPNKALLRSAVAEGRLPIRNPHIFGGMPFAGNPQAQMFYPPTLPFLLDVRLGFPIALFGHFVLAFVGAYLLGRHVAGPSARGHAAGLLAGVVYTFSGSMSTQIQQTAILHTSSWIPLFFYALCSHRPGLTAVATAGLVLSGHTQIASYALALGGLWIAMDAYRLARESGRTGLATALRPVLGCAAGLGLSAVLLVPAAELLQISMRGQGVAPEFAGVNSVPEWAFPLVVNPAAFAGLGGEKYWTYPFVGSGTLVLALLGLAPVSGRRPARWLYGLIAFCVLSHPLYRGFVTMTKGLPMVGGFYLEHWDLLATIGKTAVYGLPLMPLALLGLSFVLRPRGEEAWGVLAFLSLALTLGPEGPWVGRLFELPILSQGRGTVRFFHVYAVMAAVLSAVAVGRWVGRSPRPEGRWPRLAALGLPVVMVGVLRLGDWQAAAPSLPFVLSALFVTVWLLLMRHGTGAAGGGAARWVPHALILIELFTFGNDAFRVSDPRLYRYADVDALIPDRDPDARVLIVHNRDTSLSANAGMVRGYDTVLGYEPLALRSATELTNLAAPMTEFDPQGRLTELRDMLKVATPSFLNPRSVAMLKAMRGRYVLSNGLDLLSDQRYLSIECVPPIPAVRNFELRGDVRSGYFLSAPAEMTFRVSAPAAPLVISYHLAPDSRLLDNGVWEGADVELTVTWAGRTIATDRIELLAEEWGPPRGFEARRIEVTPPGPGEVLLKFQALERVKSLGRLNWVGITEPVVLANDPTGSTGLSERLRLLRVGGGDRDASGAPGRIFVYENAATLPLLVSPRRSSRRDPSAALADPTFEPADVLLLPDEPERSLAVARITEQQRAANGDVLASYEAEGDTTLLLTQAYYPGISASVDGVGVRSRRGSLHFTAIDVPAGAHSLRVTYAPFSFRFGLFVSLMVVVGLGAIVVSRSWSRTLR